MCIHNIVYSKHFLSVTIPHIQNTLQHLFALKQYFVIEHFDALHLRFKNISFSTEQQNDTEQISGKLQHILSLYVH